MILNPSATSGSRSGNHEVSQPSLGRDAERWSGTQTAPSPDAQAAPRRLTKNKKRPGRIGAVGELLVAADLMRRGHEVFRPVAADSPTDLLCLRRGSTRVIRIQVRASTSLLVHSLPKRRDADIVALVDLRTRVPGISYLATSRGSAVIDTAAPDLTPLVGGGAV